MSGFSWISSISIFCYLFLLMSFLSSKKTEGVIKSFEILLVIMILWTGGSMGMRLQLWPGVNFWHHVSLMGIMLLPFGYYQFLLDFLDDTSRYMRPFLLLFFFAVFLFNCFTNFFIPLPEVVFEAGRLTFLYHYDWHVFVLFLGVALVIWEIVAMIWRFCRGNHIAMQQLTPIVMGFMSVFLGNILTTLPVFAGLPIDMFSGAVNAVFLFYALYKKKLFRMTILLSRTNYIIVAMILGCAICSDVAMALQRLLIASLGLTYTTTLMIIVVFFVAMITGLFFTIEKICNLAFTRPEQKRKELLDRFSEEIAHLMSVDEILQLLSETIQQVVSLNRLFVMIRGVDGNYRIELTINPLEEKNFYFRADHPLVQYFQEHNQHIMMEDFSRKTSYRSMWESEKALLSQQQIECVIPLNSEDGLIGCILLSGKQGKDVYTDFNMEFLQDVTGICSEAVNNAYTYEKTVTEAQRDDLTGLVNMKFFFEILEREFEQYKDTALSLCLINIDDFKLYNQLYGTREGDFALKQIAGILSSTIDEHAYAARINGDEFALILPGYDVYSAKCIADNIAEQISSMRISETAGSVTVSIGICAAPYMASSARELYRNADTTVYTVKRTGKNAVQMYSEDIDRRVPVASVHKSGYSENAGTIHALTAAVDAKDHYTYKHSQNVAYYASELAKAAGMAPDLVEIVREAGLLHDIGKIGVRENILNKPGKLTPDEFEEVKAHVENAVNIIRHLPSLEYVIPAVLSHHERYDGWGYPRKLSETNIPVTGRILCIADSFDTITSDRSYKAARSLDEAITILRAEAGKQFDPSLVEIFVEQLETGKIKLQSIDEQQPAAEPTGV